MKKLPDGAHPRHGLSRPSGNSAHPVSRRLLFEAETAPWSAATGSGASSPALSMHVEGFICRLSGAVIQQHMPALDHPPWTPVAQRSVLVRRFLPVADACRFVSSRKRIQRGQCGIKIQPPIHGPYAQQHRIPSPDSTCSREFVTIFCRGIALIINAIAGRLPDIPQVSGSITARSIQERQKRQ